MCPEASRLKKQQKLSRVSVWRGSLKYALSLSLFFTANNINFKESICSTWNRFFTSSDIIHNTVFQRWMFGRDRQNVVKHALVDLVVTRFVSRTLSLNRFPFPTPFSMKVKEKWLGKDTGHNPFDYLTAVFLKLLVTGRICLRLKQFWSFPLDLFEQM